MAARVALVGLLALAISGVKANVPPLSEIKVAMEAQAAFKEANMEESVLAQQAEMQVKLESLKRERDQIKAKFEAIQKEIETLQKALNKADAETEASGQENGATKHAQSMPNSWAPATVSLAQDGASPDLNVTKLHFDWNWVRPQLPSSYDDGYSELCDLNSPNFTLNNKMKLEESEQKAFSNLSILVMIQSLVMLFITVVLPAKFPVSPWQEWCAPKTFVLRACEDEIAKINNLKEEDPRFFAYGGLHVQRQVLQHVMSRVRDMKTQTTKLTWNKDKLNGDPGCHGEFTAIQLYDVVEKQDWSAFLPDEDEVTFLKRWLITLLFSVCYEPQDRFRMLDVNLAVASDKSLDYDSKRTEEFIDLRLKQPAEKAGVALPWGTALQVVIAICAVVPSALTPISKLLRRGFWRFYTPDYFRLTFNFSMISEALYGILKGCAAQYAWDSLTANRKGFILSKNFPWVARRTGGPFGKLSNIPMYGLVVQTAMQIFILPSLIMWGIFFLGLVTACLCWVTLVGALLQFCSLFGGQGTDELSEPLLGGEQTCCENCFGPFTRMKGMWQSANPHVRRSIIAIATLPVPLSMMLSAYISFFEEALPNSSDTYLCTFSRVELVSSSLDSVSGYVLMIAVLCGALSLVFFLLKGMGVLGRFVMVSTYGRDMFEWESLQIEHDDVTDAIKVYHRYMERKDADPNHRALSASSKNLYAKHWVDRMKHVSAKHIPPVVYDDETASLVLVNHSWEALQYVQIGKMTEALCVDAVRQDVRALDLVPEQMKTEVVCLEAVKHYGEALNYVPEQMKTEALCLEAVKQDGEALDYVPEQMKTEALCLEAVKQNGRALFRVPEQMKTEAFCLEVVKQNGRALFFVPEQMKTEAFCLEAVKQNGIALFLVPEQMKTEAVCLEAVKQDGEALKYVPEQMKSEALCLEAVQQNGLALDLVPEQMKTETVCLEAVKQNGRALNYVPEQMKTEALCLEAVKQDGTALDFVPEQMKTEALCLEAVKQNGRALLRVPEQMKTEAFCLEAVKHYGRALYYVPEQMKSEAVCLEAVKRSGQALDFVPEQMKTEALCLEAVKQDGMAFDYVPQQMKTEACCLQAVKQDVEAILCVPEQVKTEAVCLEAVKRCGRALYYVPEQMKTEAVCLEAVKQNGKALNYVPEQMKSEALFLEAVESGR